jgi:hypothetical protein
MIYSSKKILAAVLAAFSNWRRTAGTTLTIFLAYFFFAFNTNIGWNSGILEESLLNFPRVLQLGTVSLIEGGYMTLTLKIIYAVLIGITLTNFTVQVSRKNLSKSSLTSIAPGVVAGGCGCGLGVLSLVGLAGATALLPFNGNLVVLTGMVLMLYALNDMGDPEKCDVKVSYGKEEE